MAGIGESSPRDRRMAAYKIEVSEEAKLDLLRIILRLDDHYMRDPGATC